MKTLPPCSGRSRRPAPQASLAGSTLTAPPRDGGRVSIGTQGVPCEVSIASGGSNTGLGGGSKKSKEQAGRISPPLRSGGLSTKALMGGEADGGGVAAITACRLSFIHRHHPMSAAATPPPSRRRLRRATSPARSAQGRRRKRHLPCLFFAQLCVRRSRRPSRTSLRDAPRPNPFGQPPRGRRGSRSSRRLASRQQGRLDTPEHGGAPRPLASANLMEKSTHCRHRNHGHTARDDPQRHAECLGWKTRPREDGPREHHRNLARCAAPIRQCHRIRGRCTLEDIRTRFNYSYKRRDTVGARERGERC